MAEPTGQLERERRLALPAALSAFLSAAVSLGYVVYLIGAIKRVNNPKYQNSAQLRSIHSQPTQYVVSATLEALATILMIGALVYLYQAIRARREQIPKVTLIVAIAAPILYGVVLVVAQVHELHVAKQFIDGVTAGKRGDNRAKSLITHGGALYLVLDLVATLGLAASFILLSINGMRAGLLSRFLGILGIIVGAAQVLLLGSTPAFVLELVFLIALGLLFLNRWPNGRGPAWSTLEAIPWPTPPGRRGAFAGRDGGTRASSAGDGARTAVATNGAATNGEPPSPASAAPAASASGHSRSKKRKRKRRG